MDIENELIEVELKRELRDKLQKAIDKFVIDINKDNEYFDVIAIRIGEVDFILGMKEAK